MIHDKEYKLDSKRAMFAIAHTAPLKPPSFFYKKLTRFARIVFLIKIARGFLSFVSGQATPARK